jgi:hypothetical protein
LLLTSLLTMPMMLSIRFWSKGLPLIEPVIMDLIAVCCDLDSPLNVSPN